MDVFHSDSLLKHYTRPDDSREPSMRDGGRQRIVEQTAERQAITSQPEGRLVRTGWPSFAIFWKFYAATLALHGVAWK